MYQGTSPCLIGDRAVLMKMEANSETFAIKPLMLDNHKAHFRNDDAFDEFLGALEANMRHEGMAPIWAKNRLIGTAIAPEAAKRLMRERMLDAIATDPTLADEIVRRIQDDDIVE